MAAISDIEIGIHRSGPGTFSVSVRQSSEASDTVEIDIVPRDEDVAFNPETFRERTALAMLGVDVDGYGQALWDIFFSGLVETHLNKAIVSLGEDDRLRMRLFLGPTALELHDLLWETLPDPSAPEVVRGATLATSERIIFSRYITSQDWQRVHLRRRDQMRALVVIADPTDLAEYTDSGGDSLSEIDVAGELRRAREGLEANDIEVHLLARHQEALGPPTIDEIVDRLSSADGYDILYVVCHGQRIENQPKLWLERADGSADVVSGNQLVKALWRLEQQPRLVLLASCMSAGMSDEQSIEDRGATAAIGPLLAGIGVPAVLAMQGSVTMESMRAFLPAFFAALQRSGQVDRAVAAARAEIADRRDAWMPVLFMRLRNGRFWYVPDLVSQGHAQSDSTWDTLLADICEQQCTVILGPGLLESIIGSSQSMAQRWALDRKFPLDPAETDDLPQIAQYVATNEGDERLRKSFGRWLRDEMHRRYNHKLPQPLREGRIIDMMRPIGEYLRESQPYDPHRILSHLPFPVYITTTPDNLLVDALKAANRTDLVQQTFPWREDEHRHNGHLPVTDAYDEEELIPTWDNPLVYHLFGHFSEPESILLTEDNYFDYLIKATSNRQLIPSVVRTALIDRKLLFLGFQMTDWDFRVLLRIIANQSGGRQQEYHVAVQVHPENERVQDPGWVRWYLEKYFRKSEIGRDPVVFWGDTSDFVRELETRWLEKYAAYPTYPMDFSGPRACGCDPQDIPLW